MVVSLIDQLVAPQVVPLAHVVDNMSASVLNERWNQTNTAGTGTFAMENSLDGGFGITTGAANNDNSGIDFNDIRHYANDGCVIIGLLTRTATNAGALLQLTEQKALTTNTRMAFRDDTSSTFKELNSSLNGSSTTVVTSIAVNTSPFVGRLELKASSGTLHIDGILGAIVTATLPDVPMQPHFLSITRTTAAKLNTVRYMEAYNT